MGVDKLDTMPYLKLDSATDTLTIYIEDWWDDEYIQVVAAAIAIAEKAIGKKLKLNYTKEPPPPGLKRADEQLQSMMTGKQKFMN